MKLYVRLEAPFEWVRMNGKTVEAFGEVPNLDNYPLSEEDELTGVVPGEWITAHTVKLPAKSKRQFQLALPYALEESVSEDVEQLHFVCPQWKAGEACTIYVVSKQKMRQWQALANEHHLPLDSLVPDHALIPFHEAADCSIALIDAVANEQRIVANQRLGAGVSIDPDFLEVWLMDVPMSATIAVNDQALTEQLIESHPDRDFRHWAFGSRLAHWLEHPPSQAYDLLTDDYRPSVRRSSWHALALPAALLVFAMLLTGGYDTYRYFSLHSEIKKIDAEQEEIVKTMFPEIDHVEPSEGRYLMEHALGRAGGASLTGSAPLMLAQTAIVLRRQKVTLANIVYRDSKMIITCQLNNFSQVDKLTRQLNARPQISARLQSSAADDGDIVASYIISPS